MLAKKFGELWGFTKFAKVLFYTVCSRICDCFLKIDRLVGSCLQYFVTIPSDAHREAWTMVMLMLMTKTLLLNSKKVCPIFKPCVMVDLTSFCLQFCHHIMNYYTYLCHMITLDLKLEVRTLLQKIYARIGTEFRITQ